MVYTGPLAAFPYYLFCTFEITAWHVWPEVVFDLPVEAAVEKVDECIKGRERASNIACGNNLLCQEVGISRGLERASVVVCDKGESHIETKGAFSDEHENERFEYAKCGNPENSIPKQAYTGEYQFKYCFRMTGA